LSYTKGLRARYVKRLRTAEPILIRFLTCWWSYPRCRFRARLFSLRKYIIPFHLRSCGTSRNKRNSMHGRVSISIGRFQVIVTFEHFLFIRRIMDLLEDWLFYKTLGFLFIFVGSLVFVFKAGSVGLNFWQFVVVDIQKIVITYLET